MLNANKVGMKLLWIAAAAILVMNLYDAMMTLLVVESGVATEANPIMAAPLALGPIAFMLAKLGMVSAGVLLLWKLRGSSFAAFGIYSLSGIYTALCIYHYKSIEAFTQYLSQV